MDFVYVTYDKIDEIKYETKKFKLKLIAFDESALTDLERLVRSARMPERIETKKWTIIMGMYVYLAAITAARNC